MMIEEEYVSFEIAKLLKEKGFNVETEHKIWYVVKPYSTGTPFNSITYGVGETTREYSKEHCIPMPTLQMAMKWLRETYNIHIVPYFDKLQDSDDLPYSFTLYLVSEYCATIEKTACFDIDENYYWKYPEQACEAAIKYCLENLI